MAIFMAKIMVNLIFRASLYALRSFYKCPMIVECVSLLFEYLFYYELYRKTYFLNKLLILPTVAIKSPVKGKRRLLRLSKKF